MPKVQIPRERILRTAMDLVIREGNQALTIGRLAKELGCSTQPISWTFGSMEAFREEFAEYVLREFNSREVPHGTGAVQMFAAVGLRYLRAAFDEPNLIHFIRANSQRMVAHGGIGTVFDPQVHEKLDYIAQGGKSRGSALYTDANGTKPYAQLPDAFTFALDDGTRGSRVQEVLYRDGACRFEWRDVRPIPEDDDFFENVWRSYRQTGNIG